MSNSQNNSRINPQGAFIVWSYKYRSNSVSLSKSQASQLNWIYALTTSLISMTTNKSKSGPSGTFEIHLAPTANWVARLTPGSWCCLLMTKNIKIDTKKISSATADRQSLKFFGRITDVRVSVNVDQNTGARSTVYVVSGRDWGEVFLSDLYVDPIARGEFLTADGAKANAVGTAQKLFFDNMITDWMKEGSVPSSTDNIKGLIALWGQPIKNIDDFAKNKIGVKEGGMVLTSGTFEFPKEVLSYLHFDTDAPAGVKGPSFAIADNLSLYTGALKKSDGRFDAGAAPNGAAGLGAAVAAGAKKVSVKAPYKDIDEAGGYPNPDSVFGTNTFWQLLIDNSNHVINEMFTDLRFEGGTPRLALYKRVKPFIMNAEFDGNGKVGVKDKVSLFKDIRTTRIPLGDIKEIHAGTDWTLMKNFIEVQSVQSPLITGSLSIQMKANAQFADRSSITRNGFRASIHKTAFVPFLNKPEGGIDVANLVNWKYLLKEWHFNQHAQLNGNISIIGQNIHIGVGDNILVPAVVLGASVNFNNEVWAQTKIKGDGATDKNTATFLTAHVESVKHNFSVNASTGARTFTTSISFTRGIFTDVDGEPLTDEAIAIDKVQEATWSETSNLDTWTTKTEGDPN